MRYNKLSLAQFVLKQLMKEMCQLYINHSVDFIREHAVRLHLEIRGSVDNAQFLLTYLFTYLLV